MHQAKPTLPSLLFTVLLAVGLPSSAFGQWVDPETPEGVLPDTGQTGWTLVFSDEFNGSSLNTSKWGIDVSTRSRAPRSDRGISDWWWVEENVSLDGSGNLVLDVTKQDSNTMYCGSISSDGLYEPKYGYLEARIQIGDSTKDTHTAFWLQGPTCKTPIRPTALQTTGRKWTSLNPPGLATTPSPLCISTVTMRITAPAPSNTPRPACTAATTLSGWNGRRTA